LPLPTLIGRRGSDLQPILNSQSTRLLSFRDIPLKENLKSLVKACQPATFGVNRKDVLDESYRKAGKLDSSEFGINLHIENSGLLDHVASSLFQFDNEERYIKAELYKLNVYSSFFGEENTFPHNCLDLHN
jgi:hypothetical protein